MLLPYAVTFSRITLWLTPSLRCDTILPYAVTRSRIML